MIWRKGVLFVSMFLFAGDAGPASACCASRGVVMGVEVVCRSLRHIIVAIRCRWCRDGGLRRRYDTCIDNGYESKGGRGA
jgi:hypothetical protein